MVRFESPSLSDAATLSLKSVCVFGGQSVLHFGDTFMAYKLICDVNLKFVAVIRMEIFVCVMF